jgi:hypothetical protein
MNNYPIHDVGWIIIIQLYQYKAKELPQDLVDCGLNPIRVIASLYVKNIRPDSQFQMVRQSVRQARDPEQSRRTHHLKQVEG